MAWKAIRSKGCIDCGFCSYLVDCPGRDEQCFGCGNCVRGCPTDARQLISRETAKADVTLRVDGRTYTVPAQASVAEVLRLTGKSRDVAFECSTGGCWACGILADGKLLRGCCTEATEGLEVVTEGEALAKQEPRRVLSFFPGHFHADMSVFTHGCNYGCDFCHNWNLTFSSAERSLTPAEAAATTARLTERAGNRRTGISGGEPTLNRRWLVEYIGNLRAASPQVQIQLDTNGSVLTPDYLDELCEAGIGDLSVDLKGLDLGTFQRITGVGDPLLAGRFLETSWRAVEYAVGRYSGKLNVAAAIPYHPLLIEKDEVRRMGIRLAALGPNLDVNLMVYQPAFRRRFVEPVAEEDIAEAFEALESTGVRAWCQEGDDIPPPVPPEECAPLSDELF
ncbi:MAG: radical SAM protein [Deltaproteobacteria bacterium]|nr:radical SAM protein [Deltaproteobacteria bacterium]